VAADLNHDAVISDTEAQSFAAASPK